MTLENRGPGERDFFGPVLYLSWMRCVAIAMILACAMLYPAHAQTWRRLGPPGGDVISLAEGADGTVYLGTADGHIFASEDRGEHWRIRGRVGGRLDGVVHRIVPDRRNAKRLLAGVWFQDSAFGGGVFESTDGASHWKAAGLASEAVRALEHSSTDPAVWVAGTRSGVFRSHDDGHNWERISPVNDPDLRNELQNIDSLAIDPNDAQVIYVGTYHLPWKTSDGGKSWMAIAAGMIDDSDVMSLRMDARNPRRIFSSACSGIYRSDDAGAAWVKLQGIPYSSRRTHEIVQDPANPLNVYAATTGGLWLSNDAGENWRLVTSRQSVANAVVVLSKSERGGTRVLAGMDGEGILRSDDGGASFSASNTGFLHRVIASVAADRQNPRHLLATAASEGLLESFDSGSTWQNVSAGAPQKSIARIFGTTSGWWAALRGGGIARFRADRSAWLEVPFREAVSRSRPVAKSVPHRPAVPMTVFPEVDSIMERDNEILAATSTGLWRMAKTASDFRRIANQWFPSRTYGLTTAEGDRLVLLSRDGLWESDSSVLVWNRLRTPGESDQLLWLRSVFDSGKLIRLLGTQHGVYLSSGTSGESGWLLVANGLPALASLPVARLGSSLILAMRNGGIYQSDSFGRDWQRIDSDSEQGRVAAVLSSGPFGVLVASESEGILSYAIAPSGRNGERGTP